jgi:hypothetical protein
MMTKQLDVIGAVRVRVDALAFGVYVTRDLKHTTSIHTTVEATGKK